jgi:hypothetical protein
MRPPYDEKAGEMGLMAEGWINDYMSKKRIYKRFKWHNSKGQTKHVPDFDIFGKDGNIIAGIEVECKDAEFKKYFNYGVHFLADKIDRLYKFNIPIYYYLVPSDKTIVYYETMKNLKKWGEVVYRDTLRMRNEKFYSIPTYKLKKIIIGEIDDKSNTI